MNDEELLRYSRHVMLADFDISGQEALLAASVLIIGAGGLGCPAAMYLASAGVGHIIISDDDVVDVSNLQRQIGHNNNHIGMKKVDSLQQTLMAINPAIRVSVLPLRLDKEQLSGWVSRVSVVLDCSDNFATRFLLNEVCVTQKKPLVSGAAVRAEGQLAVFDMRNEKSPCYRCLYDQAVQEEAVNCANNGVLAPLVGVVGSLQAVEAIKLIASYGVPSLGYLLVMDLKQGEWRQLKVKKDLHCPVCSVV
jgi:molybdopterin-synthase adenylyltransferase